jgi:hypothetical protein
MTCWRSLLVGFACCLSLGSTPARAQEVFVNAVSLDTGTRQALERHYGVAIKPARYWHDTVSGVWGFEGGPGAGQIQPGLRLGGTLRRDASRGNTGVIVNGRELHAMDVAALLRCAPVIPGRYWVLGNGVGGVENGPPSFNLAVLCGGGNAGSSGMNSKTGIGFIGEGGGKGAVFIDGKIISTPN